jgi:hypothetical protein
MPAMFQPMQKVFHEFSIEGVKVQPLGFYFQFIPAVPQQQ